MTKKPSKRKATRARTLFNRAVTKALATDIAAGRQAYPDHLMPLSECKTLDADPTTIDNYNPIGTRGEHRHTPRHNLAEEDGIDGMTPSEVEDAEKGWPSSIGSVFDARGL